MPTACTDCCLRLGIFKKKRRCNRCRDVFCDGCFSKVQNVSQWSETEHRRLGQCMKCFVLFSTVIIREDVRLLDVKHLKRFLAVNHITTDGCKEKYHLIDLVMQLAGRNGQLSTSEVAREHQRREEVESLRLAALQRREEEDRLRSTNDESSNQTQNTPPAGDSATPSPSGEETPETAPSSTEHTCKPSSLHLRSVEDIANVDDINGLSVLELKKILAVNFISYKGCFEKTELIDKVKQLWKEKEEMAATTSTNADADANSTEAGSAKEPSYDRDLCKVCMDNYIDCVFLDCGHLVACAKCGRQLAECPICRSLIVRVVHIFRA